MLQAVWITVHKRCPSTIVSTILTYDGVYSYGIQQVILVLAIYYSLSIQILQVHLTVNMFTQKFIRSSADGMQTGICMHACTYSNINVTSLNGTLFYSNFEFHHKNQLPHTNLKEYHNNLQLPIKFIKVLWLSTKLLLHTLTCTHSYI